MDPGYPAMRFIEHRFAGDWTNWWAPNAACSAAMLRSRWFRGSETQPENEVFIFAAGSPPCLTGDWGAGGGLSRAARRRREQTEAR